MSTEEPEATGESETGTDPKTREYEVLSGSVDGTGPGETVELAPHLAESFDVMPADADRSSEAVRSQLIGAGRGMTTLADLPPGEEVEAGEYEVYQDAIGDIQPGQTDHFEASVARAFADNLLAPGENENENENTSREAAQSDGVMMDELNTLDVDETSEIPDEEEKEEIGESADGKTSEETGGVTSYESPDEFLAETDTITNLRTELDSTDLSDDQLGKLLEAEQAGEDRTGAKDAIRDRMSGDDGDSANGNE